MTSLELNQIRKEIKHITRHYWNVAMIVIALIVATGAVFKLMHIRNQEPKHASVDR